MESAQIRAELKLRRIPIKRVALAAGVAQSVVHRAINGNGRSKRAEEALASALGHSRESLFGLNQREMRKHNPKSG